MASADVEYSHEQAGLSTSTVTDDDKFASDFRHVQDLSGGGTTERASVSATALKKKW